MPHDFDADVIAAVLRHMNGDHTDDNLLIARAFAEPSAEAIDGAVMTGFDGQVGVWEISAVARRRSSVSRGPAVRSPSAGRCAARSWPCTTRPARAWASNRVRTTESSRAVRASAQG